jgi:hypothetical protein
MISVGTSLWQILRPSASPVPVEPAYWEMTVQTPSDGATWTINIAAGITPNITVDWGDSSSNNYNSTGVKDHVYATAGTYTVKISGSFASSGNIRLGKVGNKSYLKATLAVGGITGLINFRETFQGCTGLTSLPADLFRYNTAVSTSGFTNTFSDCPGLTSLPADLFRYNTLVSTSGFYYTFQGCTGLTSLPADLFRYNTLVSTNGFGSTFQGCTGLTSLPTDLFRYNTAVSTSGFRSTFQGCTGLTSLPTDLFRYNTLVSTSGFYYTFINCSGLTSLPTDLFRYNTAVSTSGFYYTFSGCSKLQQRADIFFSSGEEATRFLNRISDFQSCFNRSAFTGTQGTAPALWSCDFGTETPARTNCWDGAGNSLTSLDNYNSIPEEWK